MKNRLMMISLLLLVSAAMTVASLPQDIVEELERARKDGVDKLHRLYTGAWFMSGEEEGIKDLLYMIEFENSAKNKLQRFKIGRLSQQEMQDLKKAFYAELQGISRAMAMSEIDKRALNGDFDNIVTIVTLHNNICENMLRPGKSRCAIDHDYIKGLAFNRIRNEIDVIESHDAQQAEEKIKELNNEIALAKQKIQQLEKDIRSVERRKETFDKERPKKLRELLRQMQ